jgi:hypothetical protein
MAATNKYLARSNKSSTGFRRQIKQPAAAHSSGAANWRSPRCGISALPDFHPPFGARKLNMSWHQPDLYFVLFLLTGLATFLAIIYECIRRRPVYLKKAKPLDGRQRDRPARPTQERESREPSDFSRLCESDLPPKEQASRLQIFRNSRRSAPRGRPTQVHTRRGSTARTEISRTRL